MMHRKQAIDITARHWAVSPLAGPIALVTTVDRDGNVNIAPKSWISFVSVDPTIIALGCDRRHHTAQNLLATGECVLNFPGDDLAQQVWQAAVPLAPGPEEPAARGLTTLPAAAVRPPLVAECRAHIECRLESVKEYGDGRVFLLEVVAASADSEAFALADPYRYLRPIFYVTEGTYGVIEQAETLSKPVLKDGDLRLRRAILPDDVAVALPWYQDPEVLHNSEGPSAAPYDAAMVRRMYEYLAGIGELYIIEVRDGSGWRPVGDVTLSPETLPIVIGNPAYRSRGLGGRVLALLIDRARALGWSCLKAKRIYTYNDRSRRLFERAGFSLVRTWTDDEGQDVWTLERKL